MTRRIIICELVALCFFVVCSAQVRGDTCPPVKIMRNFNLTRLSGRWYVTKLFSSNGQEVPDCETYDFTFIRNGRTVVKHGKLSKLTGNLVSSSFSLRTADDNKPGKLRGNFWAGDKDFDVLVLKSDYRSYLLLHLCIEYDEGNSQYTFILSRNPDVYTDSPELLLMIRLYIGDESISRRYQVDIRQNDCFYRPRPR